MSVATQSMNKQEPIEHRFNPYSSTGGTVLGVAGEDFVILAGDTRHTSGYSINSRFQPQVFEIGDNMVAAANGFSADGDALIEKMKIEIEWYHHKHERTLKVASCARMTQRFLYQKRFFPYYVHTFIAGLDDEGRGALYSFDPVGSYEREQCRAGGAAAAIMIPFLDNQVNNKNQMDPATNSQKPVQLLKLEEGLKIVKDAFTSATERHIHVGDTLEIAIVTKEGVKKEYYPLKRD